MRSHGRGHGGGRSSSEEERRGRRRRRSIGVAYRPWRKKEGDHSNMRILVAQLVGNYRENEDGNDMGINGRGGCGI